MEILLGCISDHCWGGHPTILWITPYIRTSPLGAFIPLRSATITSSGHLSGAELGCPHLHYLNNGHLGNPHSHGHAVLFRPAVLDIRRDDLTSRLRRHPQSPALHRDVRNLALGAIDLHYTGILSGVNERRIKNPLVLYRGAIISAVVSTYNRYSQWNGNLQLI